MAKAHAPQDPIVVGKIVGVFGVKGWLKIKSFTQPAENILTYGPLYVSWTGSQTSPGPKGGERSAMSQWKVPETLVCDRHNARPQGLVVHFEGIDDRDQAQVLVGAELRVSQVELPALAQDEYYWYQLIGLTVVSEFEGGCIPLGRVANLLETGANDVLVVKPTEEVSGIERKERLIPYVPGQFVKQIDLTAQRMTVDWDPDF